MRKVVQTLIALGALTALLSLAACGGAAPATQSAPPTQAAAPKPQSNLPPAPTPAPTAVGKVVATAPAKPATKYTAPPPMTIDKTKVYVATIETDRGAIVAELYPAEAPQHVNNFVFLAQEGFYNGLTFHRVEPGFVIQGGDPQGNGQGGPGYNIPAEIKRTHTEGALAAARLGDQVNPKRDSSGSQFYITLAATPNLDGAYTVYGQVVQGMDVVKKIQRNDKINKITITTK